MLDRIPPQSLEMEQATLGAMLIDRPSVEKVAEILRPDDFYRQAHRTIFEAILTLTELNEPVDILTVQTQLKKQNHFEEIGGAPYLIQLTDSVLVVASVEHYARIVEEKAILRRLQEATYYIQGLLHSDYGVIGEVVDKAEQAVFAVAQRRLRGSFTSLSSLLNDVYGQIETRMENPDSGLGLQTGLHEVNWMTTGLQPSDLIIVAARPSMGKTSLALSFAQHAAIHSGKTVAIFSLEMSKEQLCIRMLSSDAMINSSNLRTGNLRSEEMVQLSNSCNRFFNSKMYIDDSPDISVLEMRAKCRRLRAEHGLDLVLVDYLQLMRGHRKTENRTQEIGEIARGLKSLARELEVPVVALSQLSRAVEARPDKRPLLSDLRESGSIEAEADLVVFIYRDDYYKKRDPVTKEQMEAEDREMRTRGVHRIEEAELIFAKHRNGATGTVKVAFQKDFARFDNLSKDEY